MLCASVSVEKELKKEKDIKKYLGRKKSTDSHSELYPQQPFFQRVMMHFK